MVYYLGYLVILDSILVLIYDVYTLVTGTIGGVIVCGCYILVAIGC